MQTSAPSRHLPIRKDWLAATQEPALEPERPIIDPHHHLWDRPGNRYLLHDLIEDLSSGHNIRATVFLECREMYRAEGPPELRSLGETTFVAGVAAMSESGKYGSARASLHAGLLPDLAYAGSLSRAAVRRSRPSGRRGGQTRLSPVAPAEVSPAGSRKAARKHTADGRPAHSFPDAAAGSATLTRNLVRLRHAPPIIVLSRPTAL